MLCYKFTTRLWSAVLLVMTLMTMMPAPAYAGVALTPTLLVIEGRSRYTDLSIINTSPQMNSYEMGWRFFRMTEKTGGYEDSDVSLTDFDLSKHLVFAPRRITLGPNSAQKVRIALRLNGETPPPGDYRAHFFIREMPKDSSTPQDNAADPAAQARASINVNINFGFTVPVIYRVGVSRDTAKMGTVKVGRNKKTKQIVVDVPVTKTKSAYGLLGKLAVFYKAADGKEKQIGSITNANIFPEITARKFEVVLNVDALPPGNLRVVLSERDSDPARIYDEKIIPVGK